MNKTYILLVLALVCVFASATNVYFDPATPDSMDTFYCKGNMTENITDAHYTFDIYLDDVLFKSRECGTVLCSLRVPSYYTNIGDVWLCNFTVFNDTYSASYEDSINITSNEYMPYYNMTDNIFVGITNSFTDSYFIWLLPIFTLGLIASISKSISNTALAFGVACIPLFLLFNDVIFIYLSVVIFLAGLIGKKLGV
jgi:hypothetical protein